MSNKKLKVRGTADPDCAQKITKAIEGVEGAEQVHINMATGEITYGPNTCVNSAILKEAIESAGYDVEES